MNLYRFTSVGRVLDPRLPSNRAILLLSAAAAFVAALLRVLQSDRLLEIATGSLGAGLMVFFAWVLGRELDPDHPSAASTGAVLAALGVLAGISSDVLPLLWMTLAMRVINRTTGLPARPLDLLAMLGLGWWLGHSTTWIFAAASSTALLVDGLLQPRRPAVLMLGALSATSALVLVRLGSALALFPASGAFAILMTVPFLPRLAEISEPSSLGDATGEPLSRKRVRLGQILLLTTAGLAALLHGTEELTNWLPAWAAAIGSSLTWGYRTLKRSRR